MEVELDNRDLEYLRSLVRKDRKRSLKELRSLRPKPGQDPKVLVGVRRKKEDRLEFITDLEGHLGDHLK